MDEEKRKEQVKSETTENSMSVTARIYLDVQADINLNLKMLWLQPEGESERKKNVTSNCRRDSHE